MPKEEIKKKEKRYECRARWYQHLLGGVLKSQDPGHGRGNTVGEGGDLPKIGKEGISTPPPDDFDGAITLTCKVESHSTTGAEGVRPNFMGVRITSSSLFWLRTAGGKM